MEMRQTRGLKGTDDAGRRFDFNARRPADHPFTRRFDASSLFFGARWSVAREQRRGRRALHCAPRSSTSKMRVELGGMTGGNPRGP